MRRRVGTRAPQFFGTMWCADASNIFAFRCAKGACVSRARRESVNGPLFDSSRRIWKSRFLDVHAKAQLESRRNANPLSAWLCNGGRVAYEGKVLRCAVTRTSLVRNDPFTPMSCLSALRLQLLPRKLQPLCRSGSKSVLRNVCPSASPLGGQNRSASEESQYQQCQKAVGQLHATRCNTAFLAFDLFTCGGVGLRHRARACPPAAFRPLFRFWTDVQTIYPETPSVRRYLKTVRAADLF